MALGTPLALGLDPRRLSLFAADSGAAPLILL